MSNDKQTTKKEALDSFEPSKGDEAYLNPPDKKGIKVIDKALREGDPVTLPGLADAINKGYEQGEVMRRQTCAQFIEVGRLLNLARTSFTSNTKFGTWRKKSIDFSQSHVQRLMSVATEFGDDADAALVSFGTLAVLTNASEELKGKVIADAKGGKTTKRAEVIEQKKAESKVIEGEGDADDEGAAPKSAEDAAKDMESSEGKAPEDEPKIVIVLEEWEKAQVTLAVRFIDRLALLDPTGGHNPIHDAYLIFGIPPYHDGFPTRDLIYAFYDWNMDKMDPEIDAVLMDKLTAAYDLLIETLHS